jgi:hypothetical protein
MARTRVVVQFRIDTHGVQSPTYQRRAVILCNRDKLFDELRDAFYLPVTLFSTLPFVALEVDQAARRILEQSPRVLWIHDDTTEPSPAGGDRAARISVNPRGR